MYEFSAPMPFEKNLIDKLFKINNKIEKSCINSVYFSLPTNSSDYTGFEQDRYYWNFITDFNFWKPLIEHSLDYGLDFVYILNSPSIFNLEDTNLTQNLEKLDKLINNLKSIGCNKLRVANPQLIGYLNEYYPDIKIYLSTSMEIANIKEYSLIFSNFKNIKEFVPSWNMNKNFRFLENIQKKFPKIKTELMVNEGCIPSCPFRYIHNSWNEPHQIKKQYNYFYSSDFFLFTCMENRNQNLFYYFCNTNIIYPWEIKEYSKIGSNHFKLAGRNMAEFKSGEYI